MEEIKIMTIYDDEADGTMLLEVVDHHEYKGQMYWLAVPLQDDAEEEEEETAFIFKSCEEAQAEFKASLSDESEDPFYITTELDEDEYQKAYSAFTNSEDYDLEIEDELELEQD